MLKRRKVAQGGELFHKLRRAPADAFPEGEDVAVAVAEPAGKRDGGDGVRRVGKQADVELGFGHGNLLWKTNGLRELKS